VQQILLFLFLTFSLNAREIYFGYGSDAMSRYNKKDTMIAMEVWIEEIMKDDEDKVRFLFYDNSQKMAEDLEAGKLDMVLAFGLEIVKYFDKSKLTSGITGGARERKLENMVLITHHETSKEKLLSMKKPKISVPKDEAISKLYTNYYFLKNTGDEKIEFINTSKQQEAIFKVFFKNADAAVVTQKTFEFAKEFNPQIGENLKIIEHSGVPSSIYGFFRKSADENMRQKIFDLALNIKDTARGKQILEIFKTDLILKSTLDELVPIERLYSDYNRLKNTTR